MKIHVGAAFDEGYMPKVTAYRFLETFDELKNAEKFVMLIDGSSQFVETLSTKYPTIKFFSVGKFDFRVPGQMRVTPSPQYGAFIDHTPWIEDGDYVFFIDGDITIQRQFTQEEIDAFTKDPDRAALTMNGRGNHSMATELLHLKPDAQLWQFRKVFGDIDNMPIYNLGVMSMSGKEWRRFISIYEYHFEMWNRMLVHHAANQFFMTWIFNTQGFKLYDPHSDFVKNIHSHCHEGSAIEYFGLKRKDGKIVRGNDVVLLAHAHLHPMWQHLL